MAKIKTNIVGIIICLFCFSKLYLVFSEEEGGNRRAELHISALQLASDDVWQAPVPPWPPLPAGQECYQDGLSLLILLNDNQAETRSTPLQPVSNLQLKHRWDMDVRCQQGGRGFAASSGEMALFPARHGHSPCARLWRVGSAWLLGGTQSSMGMSHSTRLTFPPGRAPERGGRWEKEPGGMRQLVAGLHPSTVLFPRLSNLSPDCKFSVLFRDRANSTRWLRLGADHMHVCHLQLCSVRN